MFCTGEYNVLGALSFLTLCVTLNYSDVKALICTKQMFNVTNTMKKQIWKRHRLGLIVSYLIAKKVRIIKMYTFRN